MDTRIEKPLEFLVTEYSMTYEYREYETGFNMKWFMCTHSFYNRNGCFTIRMIPKYHRFEAYTAPEFNDEYYDLFQHKVAIREIEPEFWDKLDRANFAQNPFYVYEEADTVKLMATVIRHQIEQTGGFFGIEVVETNKNKSRYRSFT